MSLVTRDTLFKADASQGETKAQTAARIAKSEAEAEIAERDAHTARLRAARLARDAALPVAPAKPSRAKPSRANASPVKPSRAKPAAAK